jgi:hypothetical protein
MGATLLLVTLAAIVASRFVRRDTPVSPRPTPAQRAILAFCATCDEASGHSRTELTTEGRCARCGSIAVALVSSLPPASPDNLPALRLADEATRERVRGEARDALRRAIRRA